MLTSKGPSCDQFFKRAEDLRFPAVGQRRAWGSLTQQEKQDVCWFARSLTKASTRARQAAWDKCVEVLR